MTRSRSNGDLQSALSHKPTGIANKSRDPFRSPANSVLTSLNRVLCKADRMVREDALVERSYFQDPEGYAHRDAGKGWMLLTACLVVALLVLQAASVLAGLAVSTPVMLSVAVAFILLYCWRFYVHYSNVHGLGASASMGTSR